MPFFWIPASCPYAWQQATCSAPHRESPSLARDVLSLSGINSLQPRELRLSSQVHLLPHLSCHLCWPGRKSTAPDGGPGTPNKLCLQWWWSWFCCQHRVALSHLDLQMQWGRKEPLTAHRGPTVHWGRNLPLYGTLTTFQIFTSAPQLQWDSRENPQTFSSPNSNQKKGTVITWLWKTPNPNMLRKDFKHHRHSSPKFSLKVWARFTWLKTVINGRVFLIQAQTCQDQMSNFKLVTSHYVFF